MHYFCLFYSNMHVPTVNYFHTHDFRRQINVFLAYYSKIMEIDSRYHVK